jgi:Ca-activated chloride channel family protein
MRWLHFDQIRWLLAAPWIVAAWLLYLRGRARFRRRAVRAPLPSVSRLSGRRHDLIALTAALVAVLALVAALMRPQRFVERRDPAYERQDLIVVLDRSASMRAADVVPSRFGRAVAELKAFLVGKPAPIDRVALVGFAGSAVVLSYLTRDVDSLLFYLDWLAEDPEPYFGTDLGTALLAAHQVVASDRRRTRKIVLVVSDGDDQGARLPTALARLRRDGVPVYAVGIGSDRPTFIPLARAPGSPRYLEDEEGRPLVARFGEATLRQIAAATGGRYVRSTTGAELARAMGELAQRERRLVGWTSSGRYEDLHRPALVVAAAALAVLIVRL